MKNPHNGYILVITLLFIQVLSLLLLCQQRLMIQSEKSFASYQQSLQKHFKLYHVARWIAKQKEPFLCQQQVSTFSDMTHKSYEKKHWCVFSFDNTLYQFRIEKLSGKKCAQQDKQSLFLVTYYQLCLQQKGDRHFLSHTFYKMRAIDSCDSSLPFVIKNQLPQSWLIT